MSGDEASSDAAKENLGEVRIEQLRLYFSVTILERTSDDEEGAFDELVEFIRESAKSLGRSVSVKLIAETIVGGPKDTMNDGTATALSSLGFDRLHALARRRQAKPSWVKNDSDLLDTINELTLTLARERLIAIRSDIMSAAKIVKWANKYSTPFRPLIPEVLEGAFNGDAKTIWAQGVHRQRSTKPDSKTLGGTRLQDTYDATDDFSYVVAAMRLNYAPPKSDAALAGSLTITPDRSHISSKALPDFPTFAAATDEAFNILEKSLSGESPPDPVLPGYARREKDLNKVRGAFDVRVISTHEIESISLGEEREQLEMQAELLRMSLGDVRGQAASSTARVDVLKNGSIEGELILSLTAGRSNVELSVGIGRTPGSGTSQHVSLIRDILLDSDLISIYYETGHSYSSGQVSSQNLNPEPFKGVIFKDFSNYSIVHEKPRAHGDNRIHAKIADGNDRSIFAWIVKEHFKEGWLICDDGAGEVADFLHIANNGTLSAIHVKAAGSHSPNRRIAVTRFEEVVSQAEKNVKLLSQDVLLALLSPGRIQEPACFVDSQRVPDRSEFLEQLQLRLPTDLTHVYLVQPHLLQNRYQDARKASADGTPTSDSLSLALLENLLHSTSRTIRGSCDELFVIGAI